MAPGECEGCEQEDSHTPVLCSDQPASNGAFGVSVDRQDGATEGLCTCVTGRAHLQEDDGPFLSFHACRIFSS